MRPGDRMNTVSNVRLPARRLFSTFNASLIMPFDPTKPANGTPVNSLEMRNQLTALKALIDAQAAQIAALAFGSVPIGVAVPYFKDTPGVPALPANFVECNGQVLNDPESPLDGQFMPDANTGAQRFIRGSLTSGVTGGIDSFATALADNAGVGTPQNFVTVDFSPGAQPFPPYITAVWVIRVK
jgi:hypothetical protein